MQEQESETSEAEETVDAYKGGQTLMRGEVSPWRQSLLA